ncbi:MAG TPA: hypothetical protein VI456_08225 [Polyangia bacterium]
MRSDALLIVAIGASLLLEARDAVGDEACSKKDLEATRAQFDELYKAKKYAEAYDDLQRTKDRCWGGLGSDERGRLASDLAVAAFRSGKPDVCLKILAEAPADLPPASKTAKAIAFNRSLCNTQAQVTGGPSGDPGVAVLCGKKQMLVHLEHKAFDNLPQEAPADATFEESTPEGDHFRLILKERADLNGDGNPELIFLDPDAEARDAAYLRWFVDCGGSFYPLLSEYAGDHETGGKGDRQVWKDILLFNNMSPEKPSFTTVSKSTYRFDGAHYVLIKSEKVKRRIR